jgi:transcriptional regulator with XRE-family HTH domain
MSAVDEAAARRRELGAFLRARRERVRPQDVGLPGSDRRRTPGLRREELAAVAGVSATWYTYLEQGRDIRASDEVLAAVARTLAFSPDDHEYLRRLADPTVPLPDAGPDGPGARDDDVEHVRPEVAAVPGLLASPAYITGRATDLLAWNAAAAALFPGLAAGQHDGGRPNLARWVFLDGDARTVLVDWTDVAQSVLSRVRAALGQHPTDPRLRHLADDLRAGSAEAAAWWPRYDIGRSSAGTKQIRHPERGLLTLTHAAFDVSDAPEQVLVVYRETGDGPTAPDDPTSPID